MTQAAAATPVEIIERLTDFLFDQASAVPDDVREQLRSFVKEPSAFVGTVNMVELCFARRDDLPPDLLDLAAQAAMVCHTFDIHGMRSDNDRGAAIAATLRKIDGVATTAPAPSSLKAPEVEPRFAPPGALATANTDPAPPIVKVPDPAP